MASSGANIDCLAYLDTEYDRPDIKAAVNALIEQEMRSMPAKNYLAHLPPPPVMSFGGDAVLQAEFKRASKKVPLHAVDTLRYNVPVVPDSQRNDPEAWKAAIKTAETLLEHNRTTLYNLELMHRFGVKGWRAHNKMVSAFAASITKESRDVGDAAESINVDRKFTQFEAGPKLQSLNAKWHDTVRKTHQIQQACEELEQRIKRMRPTPSSSE